MSFQKFLHHNCADVYMFKVAHNDYESSSSFRTLVRDANATMAMFI